MEAFTVKLSVKGTKPAEAPPFKQTETNFHAYCEQCLLGLELM